MASNQDHCCLAPTDNQASIALLRRLRAGDDDVHFVHRIDVCAAVPEILVANLEPVPGTGLNDGGYSRIWYLYHAKKYKNSRGDNSGHRQRAVTGGGTFCNLTYGIKTEPSAPLDRLGWCMVEYDDLAGDDKKQDGAAAGDSSNYVLCKVYRSLRAKGKSASASSSSNTKKQTTKKRKVGAGDHPEAPPAKLIQQQEPQVQQDTAYYQPENVQADVCQGGDFNFNYNIEDLNFYVDASMLRDEPEPAALQLPTIAEPEHDGDMLVPKTAVQRGGGECEHEEFTVEWLLRGQPQQPTIVEPPPPPVHGNEFIQMPFVPLLPVVAPAPVEDMIGFSPETMYGQWSGGVTTATSTSIPWSSYTTTMLYTGCSGLLQGPDPLRPPYLTC